MYVAILDSVLGVCSIMLDRFAVAIGTYPENFAAKPNKNAVTVQIRFNVGSIRVLHGLRNVLMDLLSERWA